MSYNFIRVVSHDFIIFRYQHVLLLAWLSRVRACATHQGATQWTTIE